MRHVDIYTDGACRGNPGAGGWGAILVYNGIEKELSGGEASTTNNRMELSAAIAALSALKEPCDVTLTSDSKYMIDGITKGWAKSWKSKGWKKADKSPALNPDLWERLLELLHIHSVSFVWVKGHDGHPYNERCDRLATSFADSLQLDRSNDFENSSIRKWLNETFYENAFSDLQSSLIETTAVDNSAKTTGCSWSKYPYKSTTDKVFLLSYKDVINKEYGFSGSEQNFDPARQIVATDYSRARGVYMDTVKDYYGCSGWWLRSPYDKTTATVHTVNYDGFCSYYAGAGVTQIGVVPALYLTLK